jgi:uncharacterized membrane protein YcfT
MAAQRMEWMDTLRGAAVVAVVVLHVQLTTSAISGDPLLPLARLDEQLAAVRMPLLMLLSGALLPRSLAKGLRSHVEGKVRAILWPYAVWMLVDLTHVFADAAVVGRPVPWEMAGDALHDPPGYLWFLAWLFAFHVLAAAVPERARAVVAFGGLALAHVVVGAGPDLERFLWLFPYFVLGDVLARSLPAVVPPGTGAAANRLGIPALAAVGRSSIVYYVSHMPVVVYAVPLLWAAGLRVPGLVAVIALVAALALGRALAVVQHAPRWRWLFAWPRAETGSGRSRSVTEPTVGKQHYPVLRDVLSH